MEYYRVAVEAPLLTALTYKNIPHVGGVSSPLLRGQSVVVPLGKRKATGIVLDSTTEPGDYELKSVLEIDSKRPQLPDHFITWLEWISDYYVHPIGQVVSLAFPPLAPSDKKRKSKKAPVVKEMAPSSAMKLTDEQQKCFDGIRGADKFSVHLLHGVTGSGKTEVYLQLLDLILAKGKTGLVLVPEISLTPQLVERFSARFGDQIAVIHSHLTEREKTEQWHSILQGEKKILIGARSALFCPIPNLGLLIVDEEHEPSYKQEEKLRYHARDAAIMLAKLSDCPIVLGSATPSLESWNHAVNKKYVLHQMKHRVADRSLPNVQIVDLRIEKDRKKEESFSKDVTLPFWMSDLLYQSIVKTLDAKQQVALFLNRRGVAQTVMCRDCGFSHRCPNCEITLTLHGDRHLVCHYCDYSARKEDNCPHCKDGELSSLGMGTEQIERDMQKMFPDKVVARADRDEIQSRESLEDLIHRMESNEIDILIGTQMIAKGLDFKNLTLVGLVLADVGFNMPDFRSTERSFQLLTQVSGRSGRHFKDGGQVVIQTYNTEYPALSHAQKADFEGFAQEELALRQELLYPPFGRIASLKILSADINKAEAAATLCGERARQLQEKNPSYRGVQILGPCPSPLFKIRNQYRHHLLLKAPPTAILSSFCKQFLGDGRWIPNGTKVQVDIDPIHLL